MRRFWLKQQWPLGPDGAAVGSAMPGVAWLAGALVVVGLALFLALYLVPALTGQEQTASSSTVTSAQAPMARAVTKEEALGELVSLLKEVGDKLPGQARPLPGQQLDLLQWARAFGLIRASEVPAAALSQPTRRREFAVWAWRGVGAALPSTTAVPTVADRETLTPEERQAVDALVSLRIMQLTGSGAFRGDDDLTGEDAAAALDRLRALLEQ